jgi:hypothetical protein
MDWVYVCALEFLIFNFVGMELAETDGGVADLPAWDNIGCCKCNLSSFWGVFRFMDWVYVCALEFLKFDGSEMAETDGGVADLLAWNNIECCECNILSFWGVFRFMD